MGAPGPPRLFMYSSKLANFCAGGLREMSSRPGSSSAVRAGALAGFSPRRAFRSPASRAGRAAGACLGPRAGAAARSPRFWPFWPPCFWLFCLGAPGFWPLFCFWPASARGWLFWPPWGA